MLTLQNSSCLRDPAGDIIVLDPVHPGNFSSGVSLDSQLDCLDPLQDSAFVCLLGSLHDAHQFFTEDIVVDIRGILQHSCESVTIVVIGIDGCIIAQTAGIDRLRFSALIKKRIPDHGSGERLELDSTSMDALHSAKQLSIMMAESSSRRSPEP